MDNEALIRLAEQSGLTQCGETKDGEPQFVGSDDAWERFQTAQDDYESFESDYEEHKIKNYEI